MNKTYLNLLNLKKLPGRIAAGFFALLLMSALPASGQGTFSISELKCEQEQNPLGIDTPAPRFSWLASSTGRGYLQSAYQIIVSDSREQIHRNVGNLWDSQKVDGDRSLLVPYAGKPLEAAKTYYWKVRTWDGGKNPGAWSRPASFKMGLLADADWSGARWIAFERDVDSLIVVPGIHGGAAPNHPALGGKKVGFYKMPQFRREFTVNKPVREATAFVCGLGQFELFLNGEKTGDRFLDPAWTKFDKNVQYVTFDIKDQLRQGPNAVGVMLGNGFFNIPRERYSKFVGSYGAPKLLLKILVEYEDGTTDVIVSDADWNVSQSPITFSSIYGGEDYDANLVQEGWMLPGFDARGWQHALPVDFRSRITSHRATPLKIMERIPTFRKYKNRYGNWVYDLGQNFSGIVRLGVKASGKHKIELWAGELQHKDSTANQNATGSPFYFAYTTRGDGALESWQPQFTYYGFRYVEVKGAVPAGEENPDGLPEIVELTGLHTRNSAETIGSFTCSNPLFNRIFTLIDWAIRSNFSSVFSDCPHREKLGWLEQAHLIGTSIHYTYDISRAFPKMVEDMRTGQYDDGMIPTIVPQYTVFEGGFLDTPEWGSAYIVLPWYLYNWYGDIDLLKTNYEPMARYIDYLSSKANGHIISYGLGDWFDIGPGDPGESQLTSNGVTATAIYYYDVTIMQRIAELFGKTADAEKYKTLAAEIKKAFNAKYFDKAAKKYDRNSQTANAMALYMDLVEPQYRQDILNNLIADIRSRGNGVTAGDIGYRYVLCALAENGAEDVIYDMNSRYDVPGYGYQIAKGATALAESWMALEQLSNNHCMLGHLYEWLYSGLGGISQSPGSVAYKEIVIAPKPVGDIDAAKTSYKSVYGLIRSEWKSTDKEFVQLVEVPANTTALVHLPAADLKTVCESGVPVTEARGVTVEKSVDGKIVLRVGSGIYNFTVEK